MNATDTRTDPLDHLAAAEDAFQDARAQLQAAEAERYASIWAALTSATDLTELRAALPPTVTTHSIRAAVRRHATEDSNYIQPELFDTPDPDDDSSNGRGAEAQQPTASSHDR